MSLFNLPYTFLTTKPARRWLSTAHPEELYFLPNEDFSAASLLAVIEYTDGSSGNQTLKALGDCSAGEARTVQVGYDQYDYEGYEPAKTIKSITIKIDSADISGTVDEVVYIPYTPAADENKVIYYHNSYGGVDSLICAGDIQQSFTTDGLLIARPVELVYESEDQYRMLQQRMRTDHSVHSGHKPRQEHQALIDLFLINQAYEYEYISADVYHLRPIIISLDQRALSSNRTNLKKLSFTYRYAFEQRAIDRVGI